jgi:6-methylsalicylic acid synthase
MTATAGELDRDTVVLVLPRVHDSPQKSVDLVMRTLRDLLDRGAKARMWVLTQRVHEGDNVVHAPLWGLARVAAAEHPDVWGGVLDVADARLAVGALASLRGHPVVAVRDGIASAARLAHAGRGAGTPMQCSAGGTYLITGGTGVLGLRMAQRLADIGARRLVLLSRSGMPDRSGWRDAAESELVRTVEALEERGVSVHVVAMDIGAPGAADVLRAALRDLPPVRGVIHAAGMEAGALLVNTTDEDIATAMHPKVDGTAGTVGLDGAVLVVRLPRGLSRTGCLRVRQLLPRCRGPASSRPWRPDRECRVDGVAWSGHGVDVRLRRSAARRTGHGHHHRGRGHAGTRPGHA